MAGSASETRTNATVSPTSTSSSERVGRSVRSRSALGIGSPCGSNSGLPSLAAMRSASSSERTCSSSSASWCTRSHGTSSISTSSSSSSRWLRSVRSAIGRPALLGPAFVAAVAYIDPGNFATNIAGGARYGYLLVWGIIAANLMAMLVQYLSAKTGIATGRTLPELCREHFRKPVTFGLWVQAEAIAIATDLAEFVGAAIALNLLFGVPLFTAGLMTAVVAFGLLGLQRRGYRRFEIAIAGLLGVILLGFLYQTLKIGADAGGVARGFIPGFAGTESILLATGILGATVMPHVIYLHSALTQDRIPTRDDDERRRLLRFNRIDVTIAMGLAG